MPVPSVALLLARGSADRFPMHTRIKYKALLPLCGRPLVTYTLAALQASRVERIFIVEGADEGLENVVGPHPKNIFVRCAGNDSIAVSLIRGAEAILAYYGEAELARRLIMATPCDIPLVTAADYNDLIRQAQAQEADVCVTAIARHNLEIACPERKFRSLYLADLRAVYSMQSVTFASGHLLSLQRDGEETSRLLVNDHDGRAIEGLAAAADGLRRHRHGVMVWVPLLYEVCIRRLTARGNLREGLGLVSHILCRKLTTTEALRAAHLALNLRFALLYSRAPAFSQDIDSPADWAEIEGASPVPVQVCPSSG